MTKRIMTILLAVIIAFSTVIIAFAVSDPTISVSSATAKAGETVTLDVSMANNPGINTFSLGFDYDTTRLSLEGVAIEPTLGGQFAYAKKAVWLSGADTTYNGKILTLTFKVLDTATAGDANVAVTYSAGDIANYDEEDVNFELVAGKVTVEEEKETGTISVSTATAKAGDTVTLDVLMANNPGINTFSLGFDYDTTRLSLESVAIETTLGGQFAYAKKAVWLSGSDTTYNGKILTLTFKVLDTATAGDANVAVTYSAGDIANYDEEDVNFELVAGKVTVEEAQEYIFSEPMGSATVINSDTKTIYGLEEGIYDLEGYVDYQGCELEYNPTAFGFGTGTTVDIIVDGEVVDTYTIVIFGDINGDGYIDAFDLPDVMAFVNYESQYESGSAQEMAADINGDGFVDESDLFLADLASTFAYTVDQSR